MAARIVAVLKDLLARRNAVREVDEELGFHVDRETQANISRGMSATEARRVALRDLGGLCQTRESVRDVRHLPWLDRMLQDAQTSARHVRREPSFAVAIVLTCALAIAPLTSIYAVASAVLLRPLPFQQPQELVQVWKTMPEWPEGASVSVPEYFEWRAEARSFAALEAVRWVEFALHASSGPEMAVGLAVTPSLWATLGVSPIVGRAFLPGEERQGHNRVVMLDEGFWRRAFAADSTVVGRRIRLTTADPRLPESEEYEVVGIVPGRARLRYREPSRFDLYIPFSPHPTGDASRRAAALWVFGRLRPGVAATQAEAELRTIFSVRSADFTRRFPGGSVKVVGLHEELLGRTKPALLLLGAAATAVLLIGYANVMGLLLVSGLRRRDELSTRLALGCSPGRLIQQLATESVTLALVGGVVGAVIACATLPIATQLASPSLPRVEDVRFDAAAWLFALVLSTFGGLLLGVSAAMAVTAPIGLVPRNLRSSAAENGARLRNAVVATQAAIVVALLVGSGLVVGSLWRMSHIGLGFNPQGVHTVKLRLTNARHEESATRLSTMSAILESVTASRGVAAAAWATQLPFSEGGLMEIETPVGPRTALVTAASPAFLQALGVPLVAGRLLDNADEHGPPVALVNQHLAHQLSPRGGAIGMRIGYLAWPQIVGIVGDVTEIATVKRRVREKGLTRTVLPQIYVPSKAAPSNQRWLVVRLDRTGPTSVNDVLAAVRAAAPNAPIVEVSTLEARVAAAGLDTRFYAAFLTGFAVVAFGLTCIGVFGVLGYTVARRTHEFGVRFALGATPWQVQGLVLRQAALLVSPGSCGGLVLAVIGARWLAAFLFEVSPYDPWTMLAAVGVFCAGSTVAACLPVYRAGRIDPATALRCE